MAVQGAAAGQLAGPAPRSANLQPKRLSALTCQQPQQALWPPKLHALTTRLVLLGLHLEAGVAESLLERHAVHQEGVAQAAALCREAARLSSRPVSAGYLAGSQGPLVQAS